MFSTLLMLTFFFLSQVTNTTSEHLRTTKSPFPDSSLFTAASQDNLKIKMKEYFETPIESHSSKAHESFWPILTRETNCYKHLKQPGYLRK